MNNWKIAMFADLQKPSKFPNAFVGEFVAGDSQAHEWIVALKVGENDADLSGYSAKVYVFRQDGNTVPVDCTISGNRIISIFSAACYAVDGMCTATMKLEKSGVETVSIASVKFRVVSKSSDTYADPDDVLDLREAAAAAKVAVRYEPQTLTSAQKNTARANIEAANVSLEKLLSIEPQTFSMSGNPLQFDSLAGIPLKVTSSFSPVQAGSGDPSPDNIRAISGWTEVNLIQRGRNLVNATFESIGYSTPSLDLTKFHVGTKLYMRGWLDSDGNGIHLRIVGSDKNLNVALVTTAETWNAYTYTVQDGDEYLAFYLVVSDQPVNDFKIMVSLEDAAYEPYQSNTFILDSGQTIYGGTVNWQSGVASIDRLMITLEGTEGWTRVNGSYPYYALNLGELNSFSSDAMLCSHFRHETIAASKAGENVCDVIHSSAYSKDRIAIRPTIESVTNLDTFKEYLAAQHAAGTPVQVLYSLAAPTTIQLTPQEITTLAGCNVLYGDGGALEVSGRTDVMGALENVLKRLAALEAANA